MQRPSPWVRRLGIAALLLASLGGISAVATRNWAIAPYYPIAATLIAVATGGLVGIGGGGGLIVARLITGGLVFVNLVFAFLLAIATVMCACSRPEPPPVTPMLLLINGLHLAGAYGAAAVLAAAAIAQARGELAAIRVARGATEAQ